MNEKFKTMYPDLPPISENGFSIADVEFTNEGEIPNTDKWQSYKITFKSTLKVEGYKEIIQLLKGLLLNAEKFQAVELSIDYLNVSADDTAQ